MGNKPTLTEKERGHLAQHLDRLVRQAGSQDAAAARMGNTQQAVSKGLKGQGGFALAKRLAPVLGVPLEALFQPPAEEVEEGVPAPAPAPTPAKGPEVRRVDSLPELSSLSTEELMDRVSVLARKQIRHVFTASDEIGSNSVQLADAALELLYRLQRDEGRKG
jgi:transcriptional regulator with XRE-family HTH domain